LLTLRKLRQMKKSTVLHFSKVIVLLVSLLVLSFVGCSKKTPQKTKTQLLTGTWAVTGLRFGNSANALSSKPVVNPLTIYITSTGNDQGGFVSGGNGTWTLTNNETSLNITSGTNSPAFTLTIISVNATTLVLLYPQGNYPYTDANGNSSTYAYVEVTYTKV
jgi:hypothetical protein